LNFEKAKVDARIYQSLIGSDLFERLYGATNGCVFNLGSGKIVWSSKKQSSTALLFAEAKYIVVISTHCEVVWLRRILEDMKQHQLEATNEELADIVTKSILSNKFIQLIWRFVRSCKHSTLKGSVRNNAKCVPISKLVS
jgi:hypothetical protein